MKKRRLDAIDWILMVSSLLLFGSAAAIVYLHNADHCHGVPLHTVVE